MCGIIGGIAQRDITPILVEGLKRLEYRGYDSAGLAVLESAHKAPEIHCVRVCGKVNDLAQTLNQSPILGSLGMLLKRVGLPMVNPALKMLILKCQGMI